MVAAGSSTRMGGIDKVFAPLAGRPLVWHAIDALERCALVDRVSLVLGASNVERGVELVGKEGWTKTTVVAGGERRQDSVLAGLDDLGETDWTIVHDGARPCVTPDIFETGLAQARQTGAAIAGVPVKDTIKAVDGDANVTGTPDRKTLWAIHTPQVFSTQLLRHAHQEVKDDVTDDASMVEQIGGTVRVFMDSHANIKVTTSGDLAIAEVLIAGGATRDGAYGVSSGGRGIGAEK
jgi:2-C-methyl-D-erythritol 4-phosphate cytidylyltransferase